MSARDDYPAGWPGPQHTKMCDEIDLLRAERDALLARRDEVMRASGKAVKLLQAADLSVEGKSTSAFIVAATEAAGPSVNHVTVKNIIERTRE